MSSSVSFVLLTLSKQTNLVILEINFFNLLVMQLCSNQTYFLAKLRDEMNRLFPSLTSSEFREGCKVALAIRRKKYPTTTTVERKDIEQSIAKIIRQRSDTVCEAMEDNQKQIAEKSNKNHKLSCKKCGKRFVNMTSLMSHMDNGHLEENMLTCNICQMKLMNPKTLTQHIKRKHETEQLLCNECGEECSSLYRLKVHQKNAHTVVLCSRENCQFQGTPPEVSKHTHSTHRTGQSGIDVKCDKCEKMFTTRQGLLFHMKKHKEIEAKLEVKAATIPVPGHPDAAPGLPDIAPAHNVTAPKHPVAPPKPKVKMSKKKKEKPTLPAPSCQYEQIRADRIALKNSFLKSLNEGETSNKPFPIQPLSIRYLPSLQIQFYCKVQTATCRCKHRVSGNTLVTYAACYIHYTVELGL